MSLTLVTALMLVWSVCDVTGAVHDFDDTEGNIEFIYHDHMDLLLMVGNTSCIYIRVHESHAEVKLLTIYQQTTEEYLLDVVRHHQYRIQQSDLSAVRDAFQDRLADFHCLDKAIFTFVLDGNDITHVEANHCASCVRQLCPPHANCHTACPACPNGNNQNK